jgi:hypothetical protein
MKSLKENISAFRFQEPTKKYRAEWEVLADEMTNYFGENCFWLFRRKEEWKIRDAYKICRGKQIRSLRYLMGIVKNL